MLFKLKAKAGTHATSGKGAKVYKQGDVIESDVDLREKFPGKFIKIVGMEADEDIEEMTIPTPKGPVPLKDLQKKQDEDEKASKEAGEQPSPSTLGKDVTKSFPRAVEEDFVVYLKGKTAYYVAESDVPNEALNDKALKKKEVTPWIERYLKG